jgi:hypothetical protein
VSSALLLGILQLASSSCLQHFRGVLAQQQPCSDCRHFGRRTKLWATFNEVNVQVFCGYVYGR